MKKSIYLLAITVVTVICVVWGTAMHTGGHYYEIFQFGVEAEEYTNSYELEAFDTIVVDVDVMELEIKQGTEFGLQYNCTEDLIPEYSVVDGKLTINQRQKKNYLFGTHRCFVAVIIPSGTSLKSIDINSDVGDVTLNRITADICNGEISVGDFTVENGDIREMVWSSDTGDIKVLDSTFTNLYLTSNVGDVKIESRQKLTDYNFDLKTDVGEVKLNGEEYGRKCIVHGESGSITVRADVGDVKVED